MEKRQMKNNVQLQEFLWEWFVNHDDDSRPGRWYQHLILKRTKMFVFVQFKIGGYYSRYPGTQTMKLRRDKLEAKGEIYWCDGTWCICFYTEEKKLQIEAGQRTYNIPECLRALGLDREATVEDVKRSYHELALKQHPDSGGSHEAFLALKKNYENALHLVLR
jgi:DnaJ-like protein